jgi:hypothetical protein
MKNSYMYLLLSLIMHAHLSTKSDEHEKVFTSIYNSCVWGINSEGEGYSGGGSDLNNCHQYIRYLQEFMKSHNIKTVVDAGCGDWEFSRHVNWDGIQYIGYDVVGHVIEKNQKKFSSSNITFVHNNLVTTDLPSADLLLCKHVLQHLRNEDILAFLPQLKKFKYCIITNQVDPETLSSYNEDIAIGGGHKIDLSQPPFNIAGTKVLNYYIDNNVHQVFLIDNIHNERDSHDSL